MADLPPPDPPTPALRAEPRPVPPSQPPTETPRSAAPQRPAHPPREAAEARRAPPRRGDPSGTPSSQATQGAAASAPAQQGGGSAPGADSLVPILVTNPAFRHPPRPPAYPAVAVARGLEGTVLVRALVSPDGHTVEIRLERSSGIALLDRAALDAVRGWAFRPASVGGRAVPAWVEVPVHFRLG